MGQYSIHAAKTQFSKLIQKALKGDEVIIANRETPLVRLVPIEPPSRKKLIGMYKEVTMTDDFNSTPDEFKDYL